jgi:hypothetical protein
VCSCVRGIAPRSSSDSFQYHSCTFTLTASNFLITELQNKISNQFLNSNPLLSHVSSHAKRLWPAGCKWSEDARERRFHSVSISQLCDDELTFTQREYSHTCQCPKGDQRGFRRLEEWSALPRLWNDGPCSLGMYYQTHLQPLWAHPPLQSMPRQEG